MSAPPVNMSQVALPGTNVKFSPGGTYSRRVVELPFIFNLFGL